MRISDPAFNRLSVLKKLRVAEPVARSELAKLTGLNGGTITSIMRDLVDRGLVVEEKVPSLGRGRPKISLRINARAGFVLGATILDDGQVLSEIVDLGGKTIFARSRPLEPCGSVAELAEQIIDVIQSIIDESAIDTSRLALIGVGLPAVVDHETGVVTSFAHFDDVPFNFSALMEARLGVPVRIDNNIKILARSEHWFGEAKGVDDFAVVLLDLGIAAAAYHAGELLTGGRHSALEFGHVKVVPEHGQWCHCGANGCLQAYSSISAIVYAVADISGTANPTIVELRDAFERILGDPELRQHALPIIEQAGRYLSRSIANLINLLDPETIIIRVRTSELTALLQAPILQGVRNDILSFLYHENCVKLLELDEADYARGAAAMALEQIYTR